MKNYIPKLLHKNIIAQISLLLCLFLISYVGLKVGHNLLEQRQDYLQTILKNEQTKLELSHILQQKLLSVNLKLHEMSRAGSLFEMAHTLAGLKAIRSEITDILQVIELGGEKRISYYVNFGNEEVVSRNVKYHNYAPQHINLEIIELRAKLAELDDMVLDFTDVVENKVNIIQLRDPLLIAKIDRKVSNYFKGVEPFFTRILENSYRLHFESEQEMERISKINIDFSRTYNRVENTSTTIAVAFILLMGWVVLRSSKKILLERQLYQQELQETNDNLEKMVQQRTFALKREVAERENAEIQVKEHADFLRNIIESLAHPFYVVDAENYAIVLANSAALDSGGDLQTTCYALSHQRDTPCDGFEHPCPLQRVKETLAPVTVEHIHSNSQGEEVFVEVHGYPVFDKNENLIQMIEYSLDITEKKNAERALKLANDQLEEKVRERTYALEEQILQRKQAQLSLIKSERHYRRLIENISDIITIIDGRGVISYTSPSVEKLIGLAPATVIGHNIRELLDPDEVNNVAIEVLAQRFSGSKPMEFRTATRDGCYKVMESFIRKFKQDDNTDGYILSSRDITLRKQSEDEMHKLRMVVEQSPSSIVITDIDGTIEYVNPAFTEITGYSFAEAVGQNPRVLKSGQTPEQRFTQLWKTITEGNVWRGEFTNKKKNGELYIENVLVVPIKDSKGEITHFVAVKENITELKRARKLAVQANQAKSNFLSQMSHELRTPLNAINGFSQLMLKSKKNPLNEKQKEMTEQIHTAGHHLLQLINEVLDLARIESGEFSLSIEALDPHVVLDDSLSLLRPLAEKKSITIINRCDGEELPFIRADLTRVKQIVLNLLSNAVKYNNPGGSVEIAIETDIPGFLRFNVIDDGIGISEDKQKDIFTPFARAVENPDDIEGTGIGMTITKQLVEKMGGDMGFESQPGEGSTFWFTLPVAVANIQPEVTIKSSEIKNRAISGDTAEQQKLILYIEDNPANVTFMQGFFAELEGMKLVIATTGEKGVAMALATPPDLILLDLNLPGIDGFQVYRQLKARPETEFVPVVVVSADAMEKTVKKVHKMGFDGYVSKPIDINLLRKTMTDLFKD